METEKREDSSEKRFETFEHKKVQNLYYERNLKIFREECQQPSLEYYVVHNIIYFLGKYKYI